MKNVCLLFLAIVMFSCTSDTTDYNETCIEFETAGIEQIEPAVTIDMVGRPYNVFFRVKNGCGDFNNFDETKVGNEITIKVTAKYDGCICTQDAPLREKIYVFNETASGTYTLKFIKQDGSAITETIVIE